jgi:hypothetical protein
MRLSVAIGLAAAGLFLAPSFSHASDYCISFPATPSFVVVGRGFTIPGKGQCKAWLGFSPQNGENSPSSGVGCTSSDGSHLSLTFTTAFPQSSIEGDFYEEDQMSLALPSQTGNDFYTYFEGGSISGSGNTPVTANGAKCSKVAVPATAEEGSAMRLGNSGH